MGAARAAARAALGLARGELLPDEDGDWILAERAAVAATITQVLRLAVDAAVAAGDHGSAAALAEQALVRDPYDEVVLRALMAAHLAAGRPASALAAYGRARARLSDDLAYRRPQRPRRCTGGSSLAPTVPGRPRSERRVGRRPWESWAGPWRWRRSTSHSRKRCMRGVAS
ncbi:MAG: AfsR/SARP family transcriptional regulator [Acidimicrobiales bacterium]